MGIGAESMMGRASEAKRESMKGRGGRMRRNNSAKGGEVPWKGNNIYKVHLANLNQHIITWAKIKLCKQHLDEFLLDVHGPQVLDDILPDNRHGNSRKPTSNNFAIGANEKLLKIPLDVREFEGLPEQPVGVSKIVSHWGAGILQIGEVLLLMVTVHIPFLE